MKILIPNATGPDNMGDQAILQGLLSCLDEAFPGYELTILTSSPEKYKGMRAERIDHSLYMWCVFQNTHAFVRMWRLLSLVYGYIAHAYNLPFPKNKLNSLIEEYKKADIIVHVGGGYLRTKPGLRQSLNLCMHLAMLWFARLSRARSIIAPVSFGPFAHEWQERVSARAVARADLLYVRESISRELLACYLGSRVRLSTDTALFIPPRPQYDGSMLSAVPTIGFTIRRWGKKQAQVELVQAYVYALTRFAHENSMRVQPIIQVDGPEFGESDKQITAAVCEGVASSGVEVLSTVVLRDVAHALEVYGSVNMLLGMRMHSNILATMRGVPFVAVSYEHKTEGIAATLGLQEFCMNATEATGEGLFALLARRQDTKEKVMGANTATKIRNLRAEFVTTLKKAYKSN